MFKNGNLYRFTVKLNTDKTKLLLIYKNKYNNTFKNFYFMAGHDKIIPKSSIKILGTYIDQNLKLDKEVSKLASQIHNRINNVRKLTKFTSFTSRLHLLNAFVIGKINYMIPIYSLCNSQNLNKIHKMITTAARCAIGSFCFRKSIRYMLCKCKWMDVKTFIYYTSVFTIHKIIKNKPTLVL